MYNAIQLIEGKPDFFKNRPEISSYWAEVQTQAARHMRRLESNSLFDVYRPNESEEIKDYRDTVRRDITSEGPWTWIDKVSRIFIEHGVTIDQESLSDAMKSWLSSGPFVISGEPVPINTFLYELILPMMIEDPNALLVGLPVVPGNPLQSPMDPDSGLSGNDRIGVANLLVPSSSIVYLSNFVAAWRAGGWVTPKGVSRDYYFVVDRENFFRYIPVDSSNRGIEYELENWYPHLTGELMVSQLGGNLSRPGDVDFYRSLSSDQLHQPAFYYESFLRPFFELADEVTTSFSDNQGVRLQHNSPKIVMDQIPCQSPTCKNGWVIDRENNTRERCEHCHDGYIPNPGPFGVLIRKEDALGEGGSSRPTMEYVAPPVENLRESYATPWDLFRRAKRAIGLDLLEDVSESGTAKAHRLEDLNDKLRKVSGKFFGLISRHLFNVESLLVPNESARKPPRISMPTDLQYKSQSLLKEQAENALPADRYQSQLDYFSKKYVNSPVIIRAHKLALRWATILLATQEEINTNLLYGQYNNVDLAKKEHAFLIFREMADNMGEEEFMTADESVLFALADQEIVQYVKNGESLTERLRLAITETGN